ncbi:MAG: ABC transporter permease [Dehalococcoidales bacterium]|nr:ABC transporter permease [Dehalococcoidales bacterium]
MQSGSLTPTTKNGFYGLSERKARSPFRAAIGRLLRNRAGVIGLIGLTVLVLMALGANVIAPYDPLEQHAKDRLLEPSLQYLLGTDDLGRDLLSRVIHGSRISLLVSLAAVTIGSVFGIVTGLVAGYWGKWVDAVIMRLWDAVLAFPSILLGVAVMAVLGPGVINAAIAVGIYNIPIFSRLTRASVLAEKEKDYVLAARTLGAKDLRIVFRHIFPNCVPPLLVQLALAMSFAALLEAALSFLGLGAQPPDPSWGSMLSKAQGFLRLSPWYGIWPGLALASLLISLNFLADGLRDVLDPRRANID